MATKQPTSTMSLGAAMGIVVVCIGIAGIAGVGYAVYHSKKEKPHHQASPATANVKEHHHDSKRQIKHNKRHRKSVGVNHHDDRSESSDTSDASEPASPSI